MFCRFQSWCLHCSVPGSDGEANLHNCTILSSNADKAQLDYIGLLSTGNEEMLRFAWKTFSRWQGEERKARELSIHGAVS
jgi:hypothetical protein